MYIHSLSPIRLTQIKFTQEKLKHSFDLYNESNTRNGSEDFILIKRADSSDIQQEINKTYISKTSEISNDSATKDQSHTTKYINDSTGQMIGKKRQK